MGSCTFGINIFVRDTDKGKIGFRRKQGENPKTDPGACSSSSSSRVHTFFLSKNHFIKEHILSNNFFFLVVASIKAERERSKKK